MGFGGLPRDDLPPPRPDTRPRLREAHICSADGAIPEIFIFCTVRPGEPGHDPLHLLRYTTGTFRAPEASDKSLPILQAPLVLLIMVFG